MSRSECLKSALVVLLLGLAAPAEAHHSLAGYDSSRQTSLEGAVTEFDFGNPHPQLTILVKGVAGPAQAWTLELDNLWELERIGMSRSTFKPGDKVSVSGSPHRGGARQMYLRRLDRASDGLRFEQVGLSPVLSLQGRR